MVKSSVPTTTGTDRNKVGVYDETRLLLDQLKRETGIPKARLVHDALTLLRSRRFSRGRKSK